MSIDELSNFDTYIKKPVEVKAKKLTEEYWNLTYQQPNNVVRIGSRQLSATMIGDHHCFLVDTLEGVMTAEIGDMLIIGVKDEIYPCKPDIFEQTYTKR